MASDRAMTWVKALGAIVAIAVAAGAAWWLWLGPGTPPPPSACPAAEPADVARSDSVFAPTVIWQPAELPEVATDADEQVMLAVSPLDGGWVAAGRISNGPTSHGFLLRSTDGASWQAAPDDAAAFADVEIGQIVEFRDRAVAAGSVWTGPVRTGAWVNRGAPRWQEGTGPFERSYPTALAGTDASLLMLGAVESGGPPRAWTSDEGSIWVGVELELPVAADIATFSALQAVDGGWLAAGSLSSGANRPAWPVIWTSPDGAAWTCLLLDNAGFDVATPTHLHRSAQGWLAVGIAADLCGFGASCIGFAIAWTSPDGVQWSPAMMGDPPWHTGGMSVAGSAEGFVAVGHEETWWSADGNAWLLLDDFGSGAGALIGQPDALVMTDAGRLAVVGTTFEGDDADAWIATGGLTR